VRLKLELYLLSRFIPEVDATLIKDQNP